MKKKSSNYIVRRISLILLSLLFVLTLLKCQKDECEKEAYVQKITISSKQKSNNLVIKDGNLTFVSINIIKKGWTIGNPCDIGNYIEFYIIGDVNLKGNLFIANAKLSIYDGQILKNGFNLTINCINSKIVFKDLQELDLVQICHYGDNIMVESQTLEYHSLHGDIYDDGCPTLSDNELPVSNGEIVMIDCSINLPFIHIDEDGVQWLYSKPK